MELRWKVNNELTEQEVRDALKADDRFNIKQVITDHGTYTTLCEIDTTWSREIDRNILTALIADGTVELYDGGDSLRRFYNYTGKTQSSSSVMDDYDRFATEDGDDEY